MIVVAVATLGVALCVVIAWSYPRGAARLSRLDGQAVKKALTGLGAAQRLERFRAMAPEGGWDAELGAKLAGATDDRERAAAANEALTSAEHELGAREDWPRAAFWLTAGIVSVACVGGFLLGMRWVHSLLAPIGLLGLAACLGAKRSGRRRAARQRSNIDMVVGAVLGELYELELPARRRMRWRKRR